MAEATTTVHPFSNLSRITQKLIADLKAITNFSDPPATNQSESNPPSQQNLSDLETRVLKGALGALLTISQIDPREMQSRAIGEVIPDNGEDSAKTPSETNSEGTMT